MIIDGVKFACATCIRGHRASSCQHTDRPLFEIKKKGRPPTQCSQCRDKRKNGGQHTKCICPHENNLNNIVNNNNPDNKDQNKTHSSTDVTMNTTNDFMDSVEMPDPLLSDSTNDMHMTCTKQHRIRYRVNPLLNPCNCSRGGSCACTHRTSTNNLQANTNSNNEQNLVPPLDGSNNNNNNNRSLASSRNNSKPFSNRYHPYSGATPNNITPTEQSLSNNSASSKGSCCGGSDSGDKTQSNVASSSSTTTPFDPEAFLATLLSQDNIASPPPGVGSNMSITPNTCSSAGEESQTNLHRSISSPGNVNPNFNSVQHDLDISPNDAATTLNNLLNGGSIKHPVTNRFVRLVHVPEPQILHQSQPQHPIIVPSPPIKQEHHPQQALNNLQQHAMWKSESDISAQINPLLANLGHGNHQQQQQQRRSSTNGNIIHNHNADRGSNNNSNGNGNGNGNGDTNWSSATSPFDMDTTDFFSPDLPIDVLLPPQLMPASLLDKKGCGCMCGDECACAKS